MGAAGSGKVKSMTRTLKVLGLTAVAVLAMTAFVAANASAKGVFKSSLTNTSLTGVETGGSHTFTYAGREVTCKKVKFTGFQAAKETTDLTISPEYNECHAVVLGNTLPATVTLNGCTLTFTASTPTTTALVHLCPGGQHIDIHIYEAGKPHAVATEVCTYTVTPATIEVEYHNRTATTVEVTVKTAHIPTHRVKGTLLTCGSASANGVYKGSALVSGESGGVPANISVE